jgi:hypothetical protein
VRRVGKENGIGQSEPREKQSMISRTIPLTLHNSKNFEKLGFRKNHSKSLIGINIPKFPSLFCLKNHTHTHTHTHPSLILFDKRHQRKTVATISTDTFQKQCT